MLSSITYNSALSNLTSKINNQDSLRYKEEDLKDGNKN